MCLVLMGLVFLAVVIVVGVLKSINVCDTGSGIGDTVNDVYDTGCLTLMMTQ